MNAGEILAHLRARVDDFKAGISSAKEEINGFRRSAEDQTRRLQDVGKKMTMYITAPIAGIATMAVKTAAGFEAAMNKVSALSGATGEPLQRLRDLAMQMGRDTRYSAVEAAEGLGFLAMAGFDVEQSVAALPSVLEMAAAGGMDLATAADYASNILTGFGLEAEQMGRVTDVLAATFTSSNTNLSQLAEGMKYAAPIAAGLGVSIEETAAAMGMLGDAGIQGSMAGTTLRQAMQSLMSPTGSATEVIQRLGLETVDATGQFVGFIDIIRQLEEAGATTVDMMDLFGARGAGMIAIYSQGSEKLAEFTAELERSEGTGSRIADTMLQGLAGRMTILRGSIETLLIVIGERFLPTLTRWAERGIEIVNAMAGWSDATWNTIAAVSTLLAVLGPALLIYGKIRMAILQYQAAKVIATGATALSTGALAANTAAAGANAAAMTKGAGGMVAYTSGMGAVGGATKASTGLLAGMGAKLLTLTAKFAPLAAAAGLAFLIIRGNIELASRDLRTFDQIARDSFASIAGSFADAYGQQIETQLESQRMMLEYQIEYLSEKQSLTSEEQEQLISAIEELAKIEQTATEQRHALKLIKERELGQAIADATKENQEDIQQIFRDYHNETMADLQSYYDERLTEIVNHHAEAGTVGSDAFYQELADLEAHHADKLAATHRHLGELIAPYAEKLAEIGLIYNEELGQLVPIAEHHHRELNRKTEQLLAESEAQYRFAGRDGMIAYRDGLEEIGPSVGNTAHSISRDAVTELRRGGSDAEAAGSSVGEGFNRGLSGWAGRLVTTARRMIEDAMAAARQAAQSSSPSKVAIEQGEDIGQGWQIGLENMIDPVRQTFADLVNVGLGQGDRQAAISGGQPVFDYDRLGQAVAANSRGFSPSVAINSPHLRSPADERRETEQMLKKFAFEWGG